jgi:hypothetical protein
LNQTKSNVLGAVIGKSAMDLFHKCRILDC